MQEKNAQYRRPKTALRRSHEWRASNSEAKAIVKQYLHTISEQRGMPGAAATFDDIATQIDKSWGHEQERKVTPMFKLLFVSWCIHQMREDNLSERGFGEAIRAAVQRLEDDLTDPKKCGTGTAFHIHLKAGLTGLCGNKDLTKV